MDTHCFSLYLVPNEAAMAEELERELCKSNCPDATLYREGKQVKLDFARVAASRESAVYSAVRDVRLMGLLIDRVE